VRGTQQPCTQAQAEDKYLSSPLGGLFQLRDSHVDGIAWVNKTIGEEGTTSSNNKRLVDNSIGWAVENVPNAYIGNIMVTKLNAGCFPLC
jgi:hypothetical protein